ncbi:MAG: hypothetical protein IKK57_01450 [Clostridia bacterium]|nr:hypothetical protein [Clostridia bacterium]
MMKRILSLTLALLLTLAMLPARAENASALYQIVQRTEEGDRTLGSGVLFGTKKALLTAEGCWSEGDLYAIGTDGEHRITYKGQVAGTQLILLGLATESAAAPLPLSAEESQVINLLLGATPEGQLVQRPGGKVLATIVDGFGGLLMQAGEGLLPGAIFLGADGGLAGITVSQHGEAEGMYVALDSYALNYCLAGDGLDDEAILLDVEVRWEQGEYLVDWSRSTGVVLPEKPVYTVCFSALCNPYMSRLTVTDGSTSAALPAIPGAKTLIWVICSSERLAAPLYPEQEGQSVLATPPDPQPMTEHGFRNLRLSVTPGEPGYDGFTKDFLPQQPITRDVLNDENTIFYFQTEDAYTVDETIEDNPLLILLRTPEGYVFGYDSSYIFMPEYAESDLWLSDMSNAFAEYRQFAGANAWPAGEYVVQYLINGCEAGRFTFTLD